MTRGHRAHPTRPPGSAGRYLGGCHIVLCLLPGNRGWGFTKAANMDQKQPNVVNVRNGPSRGRSRSVSRSRSRSRSPSPAAANWLDELARDRGAGRSAAAPGEDEDVVLDDTHDTSEAALTCPISTGLLVQPMKARPCGHVYSAASARAYFKGPGGKKCAVFGCDKVLKWSDFVEDEASEIALRATTQGHVPHQSLSDPYQSLAAPATTQGHVPDLSSYEDAMATQQRFRQDLLQRMRGRAQFHQLMDQMQREGVQHAAASRQRQLDFLARLGSNGQGPFYLPSEPGF